MLSILAFSVARCSLDYAPLASITGTLQSESWKVRNAAVMARCGLEGATEGDRRLVAERPANQLQSDWQAVPRGRQALSTTRVGLPMPAIGPIISSTTVAVIGNSAVFSKGIGEPTCECERPLVCRSRP
jgi:hypothetical protein